MIVQNRSDYSVISWLIYAAYQYIMDGNHRFANAIQSGAEIQVKELYTDEYNSLFGGTA